MVDLMTEVNFEFENEEEKAASATKKTEAWYPSIREVCPPRVSSRCKEGDVAAALVCSSIRIQNTEYRIQNTIQQVESSRRRHAAKSKIQRIRQIHQTLSCLMGG